MSLMLTLTRPDDCHLHLRDEAILAQVLPDTARQFARAVVMPNLKPPLTTTAAVQAYYQRILAARPAANNFSPLMTLYLTDNTTADEIQRAQDSGIVVGVKLYPAGATTHSDAGVTDLSKCQKALEKMQQIGLPLLIHGEVTDTTVDIFDREKIFIDTVLEKLRHDYPELRIVLEHITTQDAVAYVNEATVQGNGRVAATITAHHLLFNRNAMLVGGIQPHYYCLPVLKREQHRQALLHAASSGNPRFFLGTDSAPHMQQAKEQSCGCAGCYTALHALELYAQAFEQIHALDKLEAFASFYGADFYQLPRNTGTVTLARRPWTVPDALYLSDRDPCASRLIPLYAGQQLDWQLQTSA